MNESEFQNVKEAFAIVSEASIEARDEVLRQTCGDDLALHQEVQSLLIAMDEPENYIEKNAFKFDSFINSNGKNYNGRNFGHYKIIHEIGHGGMGRFFWPNEMMANLTRRWRSKLFVKQSFPTKPNNIFGANGRFSPL